VSTSQFKRTNRSVIAFFQWRYEMVTRLRLPFDVANVNQAEGGRADWCGERCMAGRSIKVREVFAELRRALGAKIPAGELLRLAAALVDATDPTQIRDEHRRVGGRPALDRMPLDRAFSDGGWRIMLSESNWVADDDPGFAATRGDTETATVAA
jgi:hypothetical protein